MITIRIEHQVDAPAWNERLNRFPGGSIFQTTYWADYYSAYLGTTPWYVTICDGSEVVGQLLALELLRGQESVFAGGRGGWARAMSPLLKALAWWQGPVLRWPGKDLEALEPCFEAIEDLARERNLTGIEDGFLPLQGGYERAGYAFVRHGYAAKLRATNLVDVARPLEQLWDGLKKDVTRTRVRKAQKQGLVFRQLRQPDELPEFHRLVSTWRDEQGFPPYLLARYEQMWARLNTHCTFFLAEHAGQAVGGSGLWHFNGQAHVFTPVYSSEARRERIAAGDFLQWEMIRWCHEQGISTLDLSGVALDPSSAKEAGIRRFKEKWGGQLVEYPVFSRPLKPASWALASFVRTVRRSTRALRAGM